MNEIWHFFTRILKKQTIPASSLKGSPLMLFCKEQRTKTRDTKSITHWALPAEQGHLSFQFLLKHHGQPQKTVYSATSCWEVNPQCSQHTTFRKFPVVLYYSSPYLLCAQQKSHIWLKAKLLSRRVISWVQKNNFALEVELLLGGGKMEEWKGRGRTANSSPGYPSWRQTWERNQKHVTSEAQEIQKHVTDTRLTDLWWPIITEGWKSAPLSTEGWKSTRKMWTALHEAHRSTEYPELEGTHMDQWVQLLDSLLTRL